MFVYSDPNKEKWSEFIAAMHSGKPFECDEEMYYYWLECLPPVWMGKVIKLRNGDTVKANFCFAEGAETVTAFWERDGRYYGCATDVMNPYG